MINIPLLPPRSDIGVSLYPWQEKGAAQLYYLCFDSPFAGAILGDEMGLGKTITCARVAIEALHQPGSFILIVAPLSVIPQWFEELKAILKPVSKPLSKSTSSILTSVPGISTIKDFLPA